MSDFINSAVESEYDRWLGLVGDDDPYDTVQTIGLKQVLRAHFLIVDYFIDAEYGIGGIGPRNIDLLHSAIYRQFVAYNGQDKWKNTYEKCATLLFGLVKDHPFHDANKRTGLLVTLSYLGKLNLTPCTSHKDFEKFVIAVAKNELNKYSRYKDFISHGTDCDIMFISDFLRRNSRPIDKRPYTVTFHELNGILKKHGFELKNPNKNHIDVVKHGKHRRLFGLGKEILTEDRVTQVSFRGWKYQVGKGTLRKIREDTRLTAENGFDSRVFYHGADSLSSLIDVYSGPLRRLANK